MISSLEFTSEENRVPIETVTKGQTISKAREILLSYSRVGRSDPVSLIQPVNKTTQSLRTHGGILTTNDRTASSSQ